MELLHTIFALHVNYLITIRHFGRPDFLEVRPWSFEAELVLGGGIDILVQSCFSYRVKHLSNRKDIPLTCAVLSIIRIVTVAVLAGKGKGFTAEGALSRLNVLLLFTLASGVALDFVVAGSLLYYMVKMEGGFSRLGIRKYPLLFVESGVLSLLIGIGALLAACLNPFDYRWISLLTVLAKFYSNSLLAALNSRYLWSPKSLPPILRTSQKDYRSALWFKSKASAPLSQVHIEMTNMTTSCTDPSEQARSQDRSESQASNPGAESPVQRIDISQRDLERGPSKRSSFLKKTLNFAGM